MALEFEWDPTKAASNLQKHQVAFEEATTVFRDPLSSAIVDPAHSRGEVRFVIFGMSDRGRVLAVMYTERGERVRIISAREATRPERGAYEEEAL